MGVIHYVYVPRTLNVRRVHILNVRSVHLWRTFSCRAYSYRSWYTKCPSNIVQHTLHCVYYGTHITVRRTLNVRRTINTRRTLYSIPCTHSCITAYVCVCMCRCRYIRMCNDKYRSLKVMINRDIK